MYKLCWLFEGKKKSKNFNDLESITNYLKNFVYNGEWIEQNNQVLNIDVESLTAKQINLFEI